MNFIYRHQYLIKLISSNIKALALTVCFFCIFNGYSYTQTLCKQYGGEAYTLTWKASVNTLYAHTLPNLQYDGEVINLLSNFVVNEDMTISNSIINIAAGVLIEIGGSQKLILNNCKLFSCSRYRWQGIQLLNAAGSLEMINCIVEDAEIAVSTATFSDLSIVSSVFNRNIISILCDTTNNGPIEFKNNLFDCTSMCNWPVPGKNMSLFVWSECGVRARYTSVNLGEDTLAFSNTFQNMFSGIYSSDTWMDIKGCYFKNMRKKGPKVVAYSTTGYPIVSQVEHWFNGTGIISEGKGDIDVFGLRGLNSEPTFSNLQGNGITFRKGNSLSCHYVRFSEIDGYGISIREHIKASNVGIRYCTFNVSEDRGLGGIILDRSPGSGLGTNNSLHYDTFNIYKSVIDDTQIAHGIVINGQSNATDFMDLAGSVFNLKGNRNCHGIYYQYLGGTDFNRILDNKIYTKASSKNGWGIGIVSGTGAGSHNMVYNNTVSANSLNTDFNETDIFCGIHHENSPYVHYCNNTMGGASYGFHASGISSSTDILKTNIKANYIGFRLDTAAEIGVQKCKANIFTALGNYKAYAASSVDDPTNSNNIFYINKNNPLEDPNPEVSHSNWFIGDDECDTIIPALECKIYQHGGKTSPEITDFDVKVISGNCPENDKSAACFESQLQVYNKFYEFPEMWDRIKQLKEFMHSHANNIIGAISKSDTYIREGLTAPISISADIDNCTGNIKQILNDLNNLNIHNHQTTELKKARDAQRRFLKEQFKTYDDKLNRLNEVYDNSRIAKLKLALELVKNITPRSLCEFNALETRTIHIELLLNDYKQMGNSITDKLINIAVQCPDNGSHGVSYAQALLPETVKYTKWPTDIHCFESLVSGNINLNESRNDVELYPNPSNGNIIISGKKNIESITTYSITGILIHHLSNISKPLFDLNIEAKGIYILRLKMEDQSLITKKVIIE